MNTATKRMNISSGSSRHRRHGLLVAAAVLSSHCGGRSALPSESSSDQTSPDSAIRDCLHAPRELGWFDVQQRPGADSCAACACQDVHVASGHAYLANFFDLRIVDVANPAVPQELGIYINQSGNIRSAKRHGAHAFVANVQNMLVVNVADPSTPQLVSQFATPEANATGLVVQGERAFIADGQGGLRIIDVTNPSEPSELGAFELTGVTDVHVVGDRAFAADYFAGLQIIDISDPHSPYPLGSLHSEGEYAFSVSADGDYAVLAGHPYCLQIIDVHNPQDPQKVGSWAPAGSVDGCRHMFVSGHHAFVTHGGGGGDPSYVRFVDLSDVHAPTEVGYYEITGVISASFVAGNLLYVAAGSEGLRIVSLACDTP